MNSTQNQTVQFYLTKDQWLDFFGSSKTNEQLYMYFLTPLSLMSAALNLINFLVFSQTEFKSTSNLYTYLKIFSLNSLFMSLLQSTVTLFSNYRYIFFTNTYEMTCYYSHFYFPFISINYSFGIIMNILINLERIVQLKENWSSLKKIPPVRLCFILYIFCFALNLPLFFVSQHAEIHLKTSPSTYFFVNFNVYTGFASSLAGKIIIYALYVIRNIVLFVIENLTSVVLVVLFKKLLDKKLEMLSKLNELENQAQNNLRKFNNVEKKVTLMVLILCLVSTSEHAFYIVSTVYLYFSFDRLSNILYVISNFLISFKHFLNFFIYYFFNLNFRLNLNNIFKRLPS